MTVDKDLVAIHEAAHATLCAVFGRETIKATIEPEEVEIDGKVYTYQGRVTYEGPSIGGAKNAQILLAGAFAEAIRKPGTVSLGADEDVAKTQTLCAFYGLEINKVAEDAATLVDKHYDAIQKIAALLLEKGTIETEEIYGALK